MRNSKDLRQRVTQYCGLVVVAFASLLLSCPSTVTQQYDALSRLLGDLQDQSVAADPADPLQILYAEDPEQFTYQYDSEGNRTQALFPNARSVTYSYDDLN